jgi:hypothetical protein
LAIEQGKNDGCRAADIQLGRLVLRSHLRAEIIRAGLGDGRPFSVSAASKAPGWFSQPMPPKRFQSN